MKIKELIMTKNIQQKDLAAILGIATSTLSQYVTGKRQPDYDTLIKLADYFHVSTDYLLDRDFVEQSPQLQVVQHEINESAQEVIKKYHLLNEDGQKRFNDNLDDLLELEKYRKEDVGILWSAARNEHDTPKISYYDKSKEDEVLKSIKDDNIDL